MRLVLPPSAPGMRIGLYGGSFNPAHLGHRHVTLTALRRLGLDRVWWLVTPGNPLKDARVLAPLEQRCAQARRVADHPRIAVTGFCFGGSYAFALAAADDRVRAAVPFYGSAPDSAALHDIRCPVLAFYGAHDERITGDLPRVKAELADAGVAFTPVVYPDAGHAFFNDTNSSGYRAADAADAWSRTLRFLEESLG